MTKNNSETLIQKKTELISPEGGIINLADMGDFTILAGALSTPTEISVALHHRDAGFMLHFEPHGTVFKYPAQFVISQRCWEQLIENSTLDIYYRGEKQSQWQFASFVTQCEKSETYPFQIPHFSSYYFIRRDVQPVSLRGADEKSQSQSESKEKAATDDNDVFSDDSAEQRSLSLQEKATRNSHNTNSIRTG